MKRKYFSRVDRQVTILLGTVLHLLFLFLFLEEYRIHFIGI